MTSSTNGSARHRFWVGGATGFLGRHVVFALREQGHDVSAVSRSGGSVGDVSVGSVDVLDEEAVRKSAEGSEGAFLCTGRVSRDRDASEELFQAHV
ncbi:MAG TPA: NAD(P)H-binding protein, partial [Polyangiaceae bacterium]